MGRHVAHIDEGVERSAQDVVRKLVPRRGRSHSSPNRSGSPTQHVSAGGGTGLEDIRDEMVLRERLRILKELHSDGLISDTVYESKQLDAVTKTLDLHS